MVRNKFFKITETWAFEGITEGMGLALANFDIRSPDLAYHKERILSAAEACRRYGVDMLILPEVSIAGMFWEGDEGSGYRESACLNRQLPWIKEKLIPLIGEKLRYIVINGDIRNESSGKPYHNVTCVLQNGFETFTEQNCYRKQILPPSELDWTAGGTSKRLVIDSPWGKFGFLTCFDLCFSQLAQEYVMLDEVDAIISPAAWRSGPTPALRRPDVPHAPWRDLMNIAAASHSALFQIWLFLCNARGIHPKRGDEYGGDSGVWSPFGQCVAKADNTGDELAIVRGLNLKEARRTARELRDLTYFFKTLFHEVPGKECYTKLKEKMADHTASNAA